MNTLKNKKLTKESVKNIKELINESNFLELYKNHKKANDVDFNTTQLLLQKEMISLFDFIGSEIKTSLGIDAEDYENDFSYDVGNGNTSFYLNVQLGYPSFSIRLSDHDDKHYFGNRILLNFEQKELKEKLISEIIKNSNQLAIDYLKD